MSSPNEPAPPPGQETLPSGSRVAFERLRERTDELELIISGLLAFALLTVPARAFDIWVSNSVHIEGILEMAVWFGFAVSVGLSYSLAFAFIIHLAIRGYWVALIGLKSTFSGGIRWDHVPMMGAVSKVFYRKQVGDLGDAIDRADRAASTLFAMAILLAMVMFWMGVVAVVMILAAAFIGMLAGDTDRIARVERRGGEAPRAGRFVRGILRVYGFMLPQRLIMPVQLTLHSNLPGRRFMVVYLFMIMLAMAFSGIQIFNSSTFSILHQYDVLTHEAVRHGMASADDDVLRRYPMIPSNRVSEAYLCLFIPHQPQYDNVLARERCDVHWSKAANGASTRMPPPWPCNACPRCGRSRWMVHRCHCTTSFPSSTATWTCAG